MRGRHIDPNSKQAAILIQPTTEAEIQLFKEFKRVARKDGKTYKDIFLSIIQKVVEKDNPQLHFVPTEDALLLSKTMKDEKEFVPVKKEVCWKCGGTGRDSYDNNRCSSCNGKGHVYHE